MNKRLIVIICIVFLISIILLLGVPIGINEVYKMGWYTTEWGATEALLFFGSALGGVATFFAIVINMFYEKHKKWSQNVSELLIDSLRDHDISSFSEIIAYVDRLTTS